MNSFIHFTVIDFVSAFILSSCVIIIFAVIGINFLESKKQQSKYKEKKSIVETGSMIGFFLVYYLVIRLGIGHLDINPKTEIVLNLIGLFVVVVGMAINVLGRVNLSKNWANQIRIYEDHYFVNHGAYGIVRHPLYASLIWMFFGASMVYLNYLALSLNIFVFIPFMYYRTKQEEGELVKQFPEYKDYQKRIGMFFPKIW